MLIARGLKPLTVTGHVTGVADPEAPLEYHKLSKSDARIMFFALRENAENLATMFEWGLSAANYSLETVQRYCEHNTSQTFQHDFIFFSNGQFVGQGAVMSHRDEPSEKQLVIWVDKKLQGKGFGTMMIKLLEVEAFANPEIEALFYLHDNLNYASCAVAQKSLYVPHCEFDQPINTSFESGRWTCWIKTREWFELLARTENNQVIPV